jgi:peroxiredoxin
MKLGEQAADFSLKGTDGKKHALLEFAGAKALVVVFSCNHCPYVQAYEDRMVSVQRDYGAKGVQLVAINSNDAKNYTEDDFASMV